MSANVQLLSINPGSDGDGRKWPKHSLERNDQYFLERVAQEWIKDIPPGPQPGVTYRLDKMPIGYAGFEKRRPNGGHIDRFVYGHQHGPFRSLVEFYPHFKHLMDYGGPVACPCKLCQGPRTKKSKGSSSSNNNSSRDVSQSRPFRAHPAAQPAHIPQRPSEFQNEPGVLVPQKRRLADPEGVPDVYEVIIEKLRNADPDTIIDEPIHERMSPDWRTSNAKSSALLREWKSLPRYVPRVGEIVLFTRKLKDNESIVWNADDGALAAFRVFVKETNELYDNPKWEAGIVTQMPQEPIPDEDLLNDSGKDLAVNESGFRIEPMPEPGSAKKPDTKQYTYVPLHLIRPFLLWSECMTGFESIEFPTTIKHAITVASSFSVVGKYRYKGSWPTLTVFAKGVYIGSELIMPGDVVRLLPRQHDPPNTITDVMVVTSIRLLFVHLDMEDHGIVTAPTDTPYQTCLHVSGRVYTLDPTRSFDGVGKVPIDAESSVLPSGIAGYGQWYHYQDPNNESLRVELPYHRILGRCWEDTAMNAWFGPAMSDNSPPPRRAGAAAAIGKAMNPFDLNRGLHATVTARRYSVKNDKRIVDSRSWFWADNRIEQLDLHEVNSRAVGEQDLTRSQAQLSKWRTSLKAMDGKKGALEAFQNVKMGEMEQKKAKVQSSYGMVAASAQVENETDGATDAEAVEFTEGEGAMAGGGDEQDEADDDPDEMDLDAEDQSIEPAIGMLGASKTTGLSASQALAISSEDDSEEEETNRMAQDLAKNFR